MQTGEGCQGIRAQQVLLAAWGFLCQLQAALPFRGRGCLAGRLLSVVLAAVVIIFSAAEILMLTA